MKNKDNVVIITYVPPCFQCTVLFSFENAENDFFFNFKHLFEKIIYLWKKKESFLVT